MSWNEFWKNIGDFFKQIGENLKNFWITPTDGSTPYLATFILAVIILIAGIFLIKLIIFILRKAFKVENNKFVKERTAKNFGIKTTEVILYIVLFIIFLGILGVKLDNITSIFSSAILAIGLSLQEVVKNFASGIIILSSKPFVVGDYVAFPGQSVEGEVKDIKILTTVLETFNKEVVVIPNKNITDHNLINYTTNPIRRVVITLGINCDGDFETVRNELIAIAKSDARVLKTPNVSCVIEEYKDNIFYVKVKSYVNNDDYWDALYYQNEKIFNMVKDKHIELGINQLKILDLKKDKVFDEDKKEDRE